MLLGWSGSRPSLDAKILKELSFLLEINAKVKLISDMTKKFGNYFQTFLLLHENQRNS